MLLSLCLIIELPSKSFNSHRIPRIVLPSHGHSSLSPYSWTSLIHSSCLRAHIQPNVFFTVYLTAFHSSALSIWQEHAVKVIWGYLNVCCLRILLQSQTPCGFCLHTLVVCTVLEWTGLWDEVPFPRRIARILWHGVRGHAPCRMANALTMLGTQCSLQYEYYSFPFHHVCIYLAV